MQLTQTKQCANCPWKLDRDLSKIPGYNRENHQDLNETIANPDIDIAEVIHQVIPILQSYATVAKADKI